MKPASTARPLLVTWLAAGLLLALILPGCGGSSGPAGPTGASGEDTESGITTGTTLTATDNAPGIDLDITAVGGASGPGGTFQVGDKPVVTFTLKKKSNGAAWHLGEMASGRIFLSGPTNNYQRVIPRLDDLIASSVRLDEGTYSYTFPTGLPAKYAAPYNDSTTYDNDDGEMQGLDLLDGTYTIGMAVSWNYTVDGVEKRDAGDATEDILIGSTAVLAAREVVANDNCNTCHVKLEAHGGSYQDTRTCVLCHTAGAEDSHATKGGVPGTRIDFKVMVHRIHNGVHLPSVQGVTTNADGSRKYDEPPVANRIVTARGGDYDFSHIAFPVFPSFSSNMPRDAGYSALTGPSTDPNSPLAKENVILKGIVACHKCHGDPDGDGPLGAPSQGANHTGQPSRAACGSCHDDIKWQYPYVANGMTMPEQDNDGECRDCHLPTGTTPTSGFAVTGGMVPATPFAHIHPLTDKQYVAAAAQFNPGVNFEITALAKAPGGTGSAYFEAGDKPQITFTVKDDAGANVPLGQLSAISTALTGPTSNRQQVFPMNAPKSFTVPVCDFSGRFVGGTGKGQMSRVVGSSASETLKVQFTGATGFAVYGGTDGATALGSTAGGDFPALPANNSTNPAGTSISAIELTSAATVQTITVHFTSATHFTVTGNPGAVDLGSGDMPAATMATTRFTSSDVGKTVSFTLTSSTSGTPAVPVSFAAGNEIYMSVCKTTAGNHLFAIVAGGTAFAAGERFYYEAVASAPSYTYVLPMDMFLEYLGDVTAASGETFTAANLPVYWGRETVYERTAMTAGTQLNGAVLARSHSIVVDDVTGLAARDYVVLDDATAAIEEYLQVSRVDAADKRVWFNTPMRYAHADNATCKEVTLTARREAVSYSLNSALGQITTTGGFTGTVGVPTALVVSYRTDGSFGWRPSNLNPRMDVYPAGMNDSPDLAEAWGEWQGLPFQAGTYTAAVWGSRPVYLTQHNETQTYAPTSMAAMADFAYGSGVTVTPYNLISSQDNCAQCHDGLFLHGGSRKGNDTCLMCHALAGTEDWPVYNLPNPSTNVIQPTPGVTVNFRTMLHKIHMGEELTEPSTYTIVGNNANTSTFSEINFPAMPGKAKNCAKCHGAASETWKAPTVRAHAGQTVPTRNWMVVCSSCHDSTETTTHIDAMTTASGAESCVTCHGEGQVFGVDTVHKNR